MSDSHVAELITAGKLAEAAQMLESTGDTTRAIELYERIWDFAAAARLARLSGQLTRALGNAIRNKDEGLALELVAQIHATSDEGLSLEAATEAEERGSLAIAARLFESGEDLERAARCYERAGLLMAAAAIEERLGHARKAIQLYTNQLSPTGDDGNSGMTEANAARFALGRILVRYGRHEQALPHLQSLWRNASASYPEAAIGTVISLVHLGYERAAAIALRKAHEAKLPVPEDLKSCLEHAGFAPAEDQVDRLLAGRYRLGKLLGSGGMGRVYLARDLLSQTEVALKLFSAPAGPAGRDAYARFIREAKTTGSLRHPNIVALLDSNEDLGFLVLEFMEAGTLAERLREPLPLNRIRSIALQLIDGLAVSHQRGIVHRDIKPSNVFFTNTGIAKLGDFGVAHLQDSGQTRTGAFIGTVAYMAPEQIIGEGITFATDIYALGITLFQMLTGRLPFSGANVVDCHLNSPPPSLSKVAPDLPVICGQVVDRCLAKRAADRYPSLQALRQAIEGFPTDADLPIVPQRHPEEPEDNLPASSGERYTPGQILRQDENLYLTIGQDNALAREVIHVRVKSGAPSFLWALLEAAANGGPHLQRVWGLEPQEKAAVLQPWAAGPLAVNDADEWLRLVWIEMAAHALAPLHRRRLGHGNIDEHSVGQVDGIVKISLLAALEVEHRDSETSPAHDITALLHLFRLSPKEDAIGDTAELLIWIRRRIAELEEERETTKLNSLLADAPQDIPR